MPLYLFKKQNGQEIQMLYPMNSVPKQIVLQDGSIAVRQISVPNLIGTPESKQRIKKQQTKKNIEAGNRGRTYWTNKLKEL